MKKIKKTTIKRESFLIRLRPETLARVRGIAAQRQIPVVQVMRDLIEAGIRGME